MSLQAKIKVVITAYIIFTFNLLLLNSVAYSDTGDATAGIKRVKLIPKTVIIDIPPLKWLPPNNIVLPVKLNEDLNNMAISKVKLIVNGISTFSDGFYYPSKEPTKFPMKFFADIYEENTPQFNLQTHSNALPEGSFTEECIFSSAWNGSLWSLVHNGDFVLKINASLYIPFDKNGYGNWGKFEITKGYLIFELSPRNAENEYLTNDQIAERYSGYIQKIIQKAHNISLADIEKHLKIYSYVKRNGDSISIPLSYTVSIGWWFTRQFNWNIPVRLSSSDNLPNSIGVRHNVYLNDFEVDKLINVSDVFPINFTDTILYKSKEDAINAMTILLEGYEFNKGNVRLDYRENNYYIYGSATINNKENSCITGRINLKTGETSLNKHHCRVY